MKRFVKKIYSILPCYLKRLLILKKFNLKGLEQSKLVLKIAETEEEITQALTIHMDSYHLKGLCDKSTNNLRLTKYQALRSSTIVIAKLKDEVVGTISVINRGSFGLPVEEGWDINDLLQLQRNIVELSAFAVKNSYRKSSGVIIFPLMKYAWIYSKRYIYADMMIGVVYKKFSPFYNYILLHTEIKKRKNNKYKLINAKYDISAFYLNLDEAEKKFKKEYSYYFKRFNLYKYFCVKEETNFIFPERAFFKNADYFLTSKILESCLVHNDSLVSTRKEKQIIQSSFFYKIRGEMYGEDHFIRRISPRYHYKWHSTFCIENSIEKIKCCIENISLNGISISTNYNLQNKDRIRIHVPVRENETLRITAVIVRAVFDKYRGTNVYGLQILSSSNLKRWKDFIDYQENYIAIKLNNSFKKDVS